MTTAILRGAVPPDLHEWSFQLSRDLWEREYVSHSISSSTNNRPSHGADFLRRQLPRITRVAGPPRLLDLGCGGGRNATVLAETGLAFFGMDFAHRPLRAARSRPGVGPSRLVQASMKALLPFRDGTFSLVTAFTSLENVIEDERLEGLAREVRRVLCPRGLFFAYFLTPEDGYYLPLINRDGAGRNLTYDPVTDLRQRVYQVEELATLIEPSFLLLESETFSFPDVRSGAVHQRRLAGAIWQRRTGAGEPV
ncbi:class I SAM-dependent methyltransferase [Micromonospora schwarzwaldensis]|uniref:class I SAM-dependent methyltransferase n=1 Tax=Micromonospora sp. DSM 45708 TaxID=3111767 RepID=UPI0031D6A0B5